MRYDPLNQLVQPGSDSRVFLTQGELAKRWRISPRTLERWRWLGTGPTYIKVGGRVVYALTDTEAYEAAQRHEAAA